MLPGEEMLFSDLPEAEQYFRTTQVPFTDDELVAIAHDEHAYTELQTRWVERENWRMDNGVFCLIQGELTFIPGSYYGYLNYWTLENRRLPDYRETDRRFFVFMEYCYRSPNIMGVTRGKGRRQGATSIGTYWLWWICGRKPDMNGGIISFNEDAAQRAYQTMFLGGFLGLPSCFQEDFDTASEKFIRFIKADKKKRGVAVKREGLNSFVNFLSTTINAYDSGRSSFLLIDESGKLEKMDINTYWSKVRPTMTQGTKKVGFAYLPTTVNPRDKGGENFQKFWALSNQFAINPETGEPYGEDTPNRVVRYFEPATEGYAGCIDRYGRSVIDDPGQPIMGNDGLMIVKGSMASILANRARMTGEQLMEDRRDFPIDEYDMFAFTAGLCEFNENRLVLQIVNLEENPVYLRRGRLVEEIKIIKSPIPGVKDKTERKIVFMDDQMGPWLVYEFPNKPNAFTTAGGISPRNTIEYTVGVDTYRIGYAEHGSKGTICAFKRSLVLSGEEKGNYPVAFYIGRPRLIQHLYDEIIKCCMWYGCKANIEISAGDFFVGYFYQKDCSELHYWTPAVDPNKRNFTYKPGTESATPFELAAQLDAAKIYFDGTDPVGYNGNTHRVVFPTLLNQALNYNHSERTPYDEMIALMMALLPALRVPATSLTAQEKPRQLLPTYNLTTRYGNPSQPATPNRFLGHDS